MKTIIRVLASIFLLVVMYFIVADGMMTCFGLERSIQYAFNMAAIFMLIPFGLYLFFGDFEEEMR